MTDIRGVMWNDRVTNREREMESHHELAEMTDNHRRNVDITEAALCLSVRF